MLARGEAENDIRNYNYVMRALGAQGRWDDVVATLHDMRKAGHTPDVRTYNALLSACAEQRNPVAAGEVIVTMKQRRMWPVCGAQSSVCHVS
jgi:pentatricopeptide repeat protein